MTEEKNKEQQPGKTASQSASYCECDIYDLFNKMESASTLILDIRSKNAFAEDHIQHAEHFALPNDVQFNSAQDLLLKLNKNIDAFKTKVFQKLSIIRKHDLCIVGYSDEHTPQNAQKFNILFQLSVIFGLQSKQLQILREPGFSFFQQKYPFLCHRHQQKEEMDKATDFHSILDAIKFKNRPKNDGTLYGKIKSQDREYPNSIVFDKLYLGNSEHSQSLKHLQQLKITHICNATLNYENVFESIGHFKYLQLAIDDNESESFEPYWQQIMQFMQCIDPSKDDYDDQKENADDAKQEEEEQKQEEVDSTANARLFVHCEMGISRSTTIVIAYLMHAKQMSLYDAYFYVLNRRDIVRPNTAFLRQLELLEMTLFGGTSTLQKVQQEIRSIYLEKLSKQQQKQ